MEDMGAQVHALSGESEQDPTGLTDDMVAGYLIRNPSFLTDNPDLFETLTPPDRSSGDGVVDLQKVMVDKLRAEVVNLRDCAQSLIDTSRDNLVHQNRTHAAAIALLSATSHGESARIVSEDVAAMLDLDAATLCFEADPNAPTSLRDSNIRRLPEGAVDHLLGEHRESRLVAETQDDGTIFGAAADRVNSCALIRLHARTASGDPLPPGILALGASKAETFQPGQGTELITFLARVIEKCASRWPTGR